MPEPTSIIERELDYWSDAVGTFDPRKVLARLAQAIPSLQVDWTDLQARRLEQEFATWNALETTPERRDTMIRSSRRLNEDNGPTFGFRISTEHELPITGVARRYSIEFELPSGTCPELRNAIIAFLQSLEMGRPKLRSENLQPE